VGLTLNDGRPISLDPSQLVWRKAETEANECLKANLPVYLNGDRSDVLFGVDLKSDVAQDTMAQRGVCLTAA
jgi:dynein heavy chain 1